jgi:hypothetical protein
VFVKCVRQTTDYSKYTPTPTLLPNLFHASLCCHHNNEALFEPTWSCHHYPHEPSLLSSRWICTCHRPSLYKARTRCGRKRKHSGVSRRRFEGNRRSNQPSNTCVTHIFFIFVHLPHYLLTSLLQRVSGDEEAFPPCSTRPVNISNHDSLIFYRIMPIQSAIFLSFLFQRRVPKPKNKW